MRRGARALSAFAAALCLVSAVRVDAAADLRAFVTLHVNSLDQGETVAVLRAGDVLIPVASLDQAGVHGVRGQRTTIKNEVYVSLASLAPALSYRLDPESLALNVNVLPKYLPEMHVELSAARPAHVEYTSSRSSYLNYAFNATHGVLNGFLENGISFGSHSFYTSVDVASGSPARRGLTYFESDDRARSVRQAYGDVLASSGDLGGAVFIGGFASARAFDLDPYAVHYPLPGISGAVTAPATADVYVNGVLTSRVQLQPGQFDLSRLPVTNGSVTTQVVITDPFGRTQTISQSSYTSAELLARGANDFQYAAGFVRNNAFGAGDSYGAPAAMGRYRLGTSDASTLGARIEVSKDLLSMGPAFDVRLPLGMVHVAAAASDAQGSGGSALSAAYSFVSPRFGAGLSVLSESRNYANLGQLPSQDRALSATSAFASAQLGRESLGLQIFRRATRDSGVTAQMALTLSTEVVRDYNVALTLERDTASTSAPHTSIVAMLTRALGRANVSMTSRNESAGSGSTSVQVQSAPPNLYGLGYIANVDSRTIDGSMLYRSQYGDASVEYAAVGNTRFSDAVSVAGGLALIGGGVYPTRPVTGSFALVDVPELSGMHVYLDNQDVGKTDAHGKLLVAGLLPNYGNVIRIDDAGAPLNESIQTEQRLIAPPAKGAAIVRFEAERLLALTGSLLVRRNGKTIVPSYGELQVAGGTYANRSDIGQNGEFYLENVPAGSYQAHILFAQGECSFELHVPASHDLLTKLGTLQCGV